jgi:hypothetical protein
MANVTYEAIANSIRVIDVTDQLLNLHVAFDMVVCNYAKLSSHPILPQEVLSELCFDIYHKNNRTRTLLATGIHPDSGHIEPIGTIRMVLGTDSHGDDGIHPLEVMSLITPPEGWQHFSFEGFNPNTSVEFGRFVIEPAYRSSEARSKGYTAVLCKAIFQKFVAVAAHYHKTQFWALMPSNVLKLVELINITAMPIPQLSLNTEDHSDLFMKYDKYWQQSNPWFYKFILEKGEN